MRRLAPSLIAACCLLAACGGENASTPIACLAGTGAYLRALEAAPGPVRLAGETPIADCLTDNQPGGELAQVGESTVGAATELNRRARVDRGGQAAVSLGYLIGALERSAGETGGIHADLIRRLEAAARFTPRGMPVPESFDRAYQKGYAAGEGGG